MQINDLGVAREHWHNCCFEPARPTSLITRRVHEIDQRRSIVRSACWVLQAQHKQVSRPPGQLTTTTTSAASRKRPRIPRSRRASTTRTTAAGTSAPGPATSISASTRRSGSDDPDLEVDVYAGFTKTLERGLSYDFGGVYYAYPARVRLQLHRDLRGVGITRRLVQGQVLVLAGVRRRRREDLGDTPAGVHPGELHVPAAGELLARSRTSATAPATTGTTLRRRALDYAVGVGYTAGKFNSR